MEAALRQEQGLGLATMCECCMHSARALARTAPTANSCRTCCARQVQSNVQQRRSSVRQGAGGKGASRLLHTLPFICWTELLFLS